MTVEKQTYKNKIAVKPLLSTISSGCQTPLIEVKFCNLVKPYYYPNSPKIPRYSITCVFDPSEHPDFIDGLTTIEKNEQVDSILKPEIVKEDGISLQTGRLIIKFQTKDFIPLYILNDKDQSVQIELEDELAQGEKVIIFYDILRYTKKNESENRHGLSYKPTYIYYYPEQGLNAAS